MNVLKWPTPPFSSVLKLVVEVFLPKNVRFGKYGSFGVFGLHGHLDPIAIFFFGFWEDLPPHFQVLWIQWCKKPTIIYHHLEDMGGFDFSVSGWLSLYVQRIWRFSRPVMPSFAKLWKHVKFCQKYRVCHNFCQIYGVMPKI